MKILKYEDNRECKKNVTTPYLIKGVNSIEPNPSINNKICKEFMDQVAKTGQLQEDFEKNEKAKEIPSIKAAKVREKIQLENINFSSNRSCYRSSSLVTTMMKSAVTRSLVKKLQR